LPESFETSKGCLIVEVRMEYVERMASLRVVQGQSLVGSSSVRRAVSCFHVVGESSIQGIRNSIDEEI